MILWGPGRLVVLAVLLFTGCGGSSSGAYAVEVCTALDRWVEAVNGSLDELRGEAEQRTSVAQERSAVLLHLDDVASAGAALRQDLKAAPGETSSEQQVTDRLVALVERLEREVDRIRVRVEKIQADDVQAFREIAGPTLGEDLGAVIREALGTPTEAEGDVAEAFEGEPACDGVLLDEAPEGGPA